ncbi:hypothetical protein H4O20_05185 [Aequorivita sp. 609]|uniref:hypothetical protein n=1 Tax=Aequorivita TaxID=153265 RepID=UPI0016208575|nr:MULTISPECIES: hypothetical protein [Aequorivita]MBB6680830.1 hypothetical protein [Aequorivita sp. 609]
MKKYLLLFLPLTLLSCLQEPKKEINTNYIQEINTELIPEKPIIKDSNLTFLKSFNGKYPNEAKIFENKKFTDRLKSVLGSKYEYLIETWQVEKPIEIDDNFFISWACQKHNCYNTNFIIIYNFEKDIIEIGIREEMNTSVFSDGVKKSNILTDWERDI